MELAIERRFDVYFHIPATGARLSWAASPLEADAPHLTHAATAFVIMTVSTQAALDRG